MAVVLAFDSSHPRGVRLDYNYFTLMDQVSTFLLLILLEDSTSQVLIQSLGGNSSLQDDTRNLGYLSDVAIRIEGEQIYLQFENYQNFDLRC